MPESFNTRRGRGESIESAKARLTVHVGAREEFKRERMLASEHGVETIDPMYAGRGPAMSPVSSMNKRSLDYTVCTGLAVLGRGADGVRISFASHQVPTWRAETMQEYETKIRARLRECIERSGQQGIDAVFFGGEYVDHIDDSDPEAERSRNKNQAYDAMKEALSRAVREELAVEMRLVDTPNAPGNHADMFLDTQNATLYIEHW